MARKPIDRNDPTDRRMLDDFDTGRARLSDSAGGIGDEARRLARKSSAAGGGGAYQPGASLEKQWRSIYARKTRAELRQEQDALDAEEERLHLAEYRNEADIGLTRLRQRLVAERLQQMRER